MVNKSTITQTKLGNGVLVGVNDHVYLTPEHLGEPYYIGRVMEFCRVPNRKGLQVRVAWYSRPKDVFNRKWYDASMLIATMNSDLNPVSSIRGKCIVLHKHYIPKDRFETYKTQEDCFYYTQMYDRYMQRVYDLLPCDLVQNVPMDVQEALCQRYQFIVVEQGKAADLIGARRTCCVCQTWCNSTSSVKCAGCQKSFHMSCLSPPLTRKPSKGFAWQCAFCSKKEMEDLVVSSPGSAKDSTTPTRSISPGKRTVRLRSHQQQQQQQQQKVQQKKEKHPHEQKPSASKQASSASNNLKIFEDPSQIKTTHMWPFRYFGVNTNIKDILDIDDRIYPRAASRIGSRYQAFVPDWKDASDQHHETSTAATSSLKKTSRHSPSSITTISSQSSFTDDSLDQDSSSQLHNNRHSSRRSERRGKSTKRKDTSPKQHPEDHLLGLEDDKTPTRGTDDSVTPLFSQPDRLKDKELDDYISKVQSLPNLPLAPYSVDTFDLALQMLEENNYNTDAALNKISRVTKDDFEFLVSWQADEIESFEQSIKEHGHELQFVKRCIPTKSMADIVRFFYQWKKSDRYEPVYSVWTKVFKPAKQFKKKTRSLMECLSKSQQKDAALIEQLTLQAKIGQQHHNEIQQDYSPGATTMNNTDYSADSDNDDNDDDKDKDYKEKTKPSKRRSATTITRPTRSTRTTRQSAALVKLTADAEKKSITSDTTTNTTTSSSKTTQQDQNNDDDIGNNMIDPSIIPSTTTSKNGQPFECLYCHTKESDIWRRVPGDTDRKQTSFDRALCDDCGTHWLKYARKRLVTDTMVETNGTTASTASSATSSPRGRSRIAKRKHTENDSGSDGLSSKRVKEENSASLSRLLSPCQVCYSMDQPKRLVSCLDCDMVVHDDCFGIDKNNMGQWRCDVCKNKKKPVVSYFYQCILCGNDPCGKQEAMKATSGYNWAHISCALFFSQVKFINSSTMSPIEFAGSISNRKRNQTCQVCFRNGQGACVPCADENCKTQVHVQCALKNGYQAGFTIATSPPPTSSSSSTSLNHNSSHEPVVDSGTFGRSSAKGVMIPKIYCPQHNASSYRHFYPMSTRTPGNKSWITIYSNLYKQIDLNTTPAMRRQYSWCLRNDLDLPNYLKNSHSPFIDRLPKNNSTSSRTTRKNGTISTSNNNLSTLLNPSCSQCPVTSSPFWWNANDISNTEHLSNNEPKLCQRCYCNRRYDISVIINQTTPL